MVRLRPRPRRRFEVSEVVLKSKAPNQRDRGKSGDEATTQTTTTKAKTTRDLAKCNRHAWLFILPGPQKSMQNNSILGYYYRVLSHYFTSCSLRSGFVLELHLGTLMFPTLRRVPKNQGPKHRPQIVGLLSLYRDTHKTHLPNFWKHPSSYHRGQL